MYIQEKYAINDPLIVYFLPSTFMSRILNHKQLLNLKPYFENFLKNSLSKYDMETRKYVTNSDLPMFWEDERLDVWWNKVFKSSRLPVLSSLVHPFLSILTRPTAEC